jgi:hypothetical protein
VNAKINSAKAELAVELVARLSTGKGLSLHANLPLPPLIESAPQVLPRGVFGIRKQRTPPTGPSRSAAMESVKAENGGAGTSRWSSSALNAAGYRIPRGAGGELRFI